MGGPYKNIFKRLIYPFFPQNGPGGGAGILPDFTRGGTKYLNTTLLKTYLKSNFMDSERHAFRIQRPQNMGGPGENFFKRLIYPFFARNGPPGGGAFYQISPDVALTTCIQLYSETYEKSIFFKLRQHVLWIQRCRNRGGPHENILKRLIYPFFPKNGPRGGGGVLPDFTRRGTNYLHANFT